MIIPSVAKVFNQVWGSKVCSPHVGNVLAVAPINLSPSSAYRIDLKKNPPQKVSHKDKNHFYGSDSTRNGGYALTPMPWTGPAPRTRTGRGLQDPSPPMRRRARTADGVLATDDPQCVLPSRHIGYARPWPSAHLVTLYIVRVWSTLQIFRLRTVFTNEITCSRSLFKVLGCV